MKTPFRKSKHQRGFTLILVMSMLMLLVMIGVGVLSLSAVTLRQSTNERAMVTARSNARMALQLALGDLQKSCGRDQSVTAHASLLGDDPKNTQWTGVWRTDIADAEPHWLVSQNDPSQEIDPLDVLSGGKVTVVSKYDQQEPVEVPLVKVDADS